MRVRIERWYVYWLYFPMPRVEVIVMWVFPTVLLHSSKDQCISWFTIMYCVWLHSQTMITSLLTNWGGFCWQDLMALHVYLTINVKTDINQFDGLPVPFNTRTFLGCGLQATYFALFLEGWTGVHNCMLLLLFGCNLCNFKSGNDAFVIYNFAFLPQYLMEIFSVFKISRRFDRCLSLY